MDTIIYSTICGASPVPSDQPDDSQYSDAGPYRLTIQQTFLDGMYTQCESGLPLEVCGLLAGVPITPHHMRVTQVFPITNQYQSKTRYRMDAQEQVQAFIEIETRGWELAAIYHSHPRGPDHPSATDIKESYYPETAYLIWSKGSGAWVCRAYRIQEGQVSAVQLVIA